MRERVANFHIPHSSLLALEAVIFQAGMAYSNSDQNNIITINNSTQATCQCMYES